MTETKIHYKGYRCGTQGHRWSSSTISSNSNPAKVTCKKCLAEVERRDVAGSTTVKGKP